MWSFCHVQYFQLRTSPNHCPSMKPEIELTHSSQLCNAFFSIKHGHPGYCPSLRLSFPNWHLFPFPRLVLIFVFLSTMKWHTGGIMPVAGPATQRSSSFYHCSQLPCLLIKMTISHCLKNTADSLSSKQICNPSKICVITSDCNWTWRSWSLFSSGLFAGRHLAVQRNTSHLSVEKSPCEDSGKRWPCGTESSENTNLLTLWPWTSKFQNSEQINLRFMPLCGILI